MISAPLSNVGSARAAALERWDIWALAALACVAACASLFYGRAAFPLDDAFITIHNADVLPHGADSAFPGVSPLVGATSLAHLWIVALFQGVLGAGYASAAAGALAAIAYALGLRALALRAGASKLEAFALASAGAVGGYGLYHLGNGLETGLAMAGVAWTLYAAFSPYPNHITAAACGVLPFIRPELALLSAALMARQIYLRWSVDPLATLVRDIAIALACAAPFLWWSLNETGALSPSTIAAKAAFFARPGGALVDIATMAASVLSCGLGVFWYGAYGLRRSSLGVAAIAFGAGLIGAFTITLPDALSHNHFRYLYPLAPALILGAAMEIGARRGTDRTMLLALVCVWGFASAGFLSAPRMLSEIGRGLDSAAFMARRLPEGAVVLAHDIGRPAALTHVRVVDAVGLKTRDAADIHIRLTGPSEGVRRGDANGEIAAMYSPSFAEIRTGDPFWAAIGNDLRVRGWRLTPLYADARGDYTVFALSPPERPATDNASD